MTYLTLKEFPTQQLSSNQSDLLLRLMVVAKGRLLDEVQADSLDDVDFLGKVFSRRLVAHGVRVHIGAALFVLFLQETPAHAVLWAWTLFNMQRDDDHVISLSDVCMAFPNGFPTPDAYSACWDAQKVGGANALDNSETWVRPRTL